MEGGGRWEEGPKLVHKFLLVRLHPKVNVLATRPQTRFRTAKAVAYTKGGKTYTLRNLERSLLG